MQEIIRTLVMSRKAGETFILKIDDQIILDLLVVSVSNKTVTLSFRLSDKIKISTIKNLVVKKVDKN